MMGSFGLRLVLRDNWRLRVAAVVSRRQNGQVCGQAVGHRPGAGRLLFEGVVAPVAAVAGVSGC
jgi:hypothetical protein